MTRDFYIEALDSGDTAWRIDWFGHLAIYDRTIRWTRPSICVAISAIVAESQFLPFLSQQSANTPQQRQIWLSIGLLTVLRVGDIWKGGKLFLTPDHELEIFPDILINRDSVSSIKAGARQGDADFFLPLNQHPRHEAHTKSSCLLVDLQNNQQIVIPCWELIRFYFGSSANLLNHLVRPGLETGSLYKRMHHNLLSDHMYMELADGIAKGSAADIARIAGSLVAWRAAARISKSCLESATRALPIYPYTFFPFEGITTLVAAGKWLARNGQAKATFVVFNLRSCTHPFPFKKLHYRQGSSQITTIQEPIVGPKNPREDRHIISLPKERKVFIREEDPGRSKTPKTIAVETERRFPDLEKKDIWCSKTVAKDNTAEKIVPVPISPPSGQNWAATGDPVSSRPIRAIDISVDIVPGSGRTRAGIPSFVKNALLALSLPIEAKIELLYPGSFSSPVFQVPTVSDEDGVIPEGCFSVTSTGKQRPRQAAALIVRTSDSLKGTSQLIIVVEQKFNMAECATGQAEWSADRAIALEQLARYAAWVAIWEI